MCLLAEGIENNDIGVGRVRWSKGLSDGYGCVIRGRGIRDASEGSETTTEAAGSRQQARLIYDNYGGVGGGR